MSIDSTALDTDRVLLGLLELHFDCLEALRIATCFFGFPCCMRLSLKENWVLLSVGGSIALKLANVLFGVASEDVDDVG